ncbi:hypothetical protein GLO26_00675 [Carnobacterium inhibens]|uniref:Uncharacterized protein n=2 Tax=Carnobacterium inhibens TaxID=147709 RepID=A0ABR7T8M2_9LACT|nr:hypothetical protein [Carnobacterium inhibens]MBC9824341.1 hypothetical protein [Carnobacterium inhibens]
MTFDIAGITNEKNDEYLNLAGGIQVAVTSNRSVMGSINLVAEELISLRLNTPLYKFSRPLGRKNTNNSKTFV